MVATIVNVTPRSGCNRVKPDKHRDGPPCTVIEAACVLAPIRDQRAYEQAHFEFLADCLLTLEEAILGPAPPEPAP